MLLNNNVKCKRTFFKLDVIKRGEESIWVCCERILLHPFTLFLIALIFPVSSFPFQTFLVLKVLIDSLGCSFFLFANTSDGINAERNRIVLSLFIILTLPSITSKHATDQARFWIIWPKLCISIEIDIKQYPFILYFLCNTL